MLYEMHHFVGAQTPSALPFVFWSLFLSCSFNLNTLVFSLPLSSFFSLFFSFVVFSMPGVAGSFWSDLTTFSLLCRPTWPYQLPFRQNPCHVIITMYIANLLNLHPAHPILGLCFYFFCSQRRGYFIFSWRGFFFFFFSLFFSLLSFLYISRGKRVLCRNQIEAFNLGRVHLDSEGGVLFA